MLTKIEGVELTFDVNGKISKYTIDEICQINQDDITSDMVRQASLYGFFSNMLSRQEWETIKAKAMMEQTYGQADEIYRAEILTSGEKLREAAVKGMVINDEDYIEAESKHQHAVYLQSVLMNICRTLSMKSDMLISLGAQLRAELHMTGMKTKEKKYESEIDQMKAKLDKS